MSIEDVPNANEGVLVTRSRGAAEAAGIKPGDLLIKVNDISVNSVDDVVNALSKGEKTAVTCEVLRDHKFDSFIPCPKCNPEAPRKLGHRGRCNISGVRQAPRKKAKWPSPDR